MIEEICQFCNTIKNPECECLEIEMCVYCEKPQDECECDEDDE